MIQTQNNPPSKHYDLEERTLAFSKSVRSFVKKLPNTKSNWEDISQLVRSSGSIGANYIEANESLSKKDFAMRVKISRKEAKETGYWLQLLDLGEDRELNKEKDSLVGEVGELMKIFGAIIEKVKF